MLRIGKLSAEELNMYRNKAGYTAISCGRVGRGGYARFPTFQLNHYGPTDTFRLVFTDRPTDGPTDGRTDKASYRVACPQLKMSIETFTNNHN